MQYIYGSMAGIAQYCGNLPTLSLQAQLNCRRLDPRSLCNRHVARVLIELVWHF